MSFWQKKITTYFLFFFYRIKKGGIDTDGDRIISRVCDSSEPRWKATPLNVSSEHKRDKYKFLFFNFTFLNIL